MMFRKSERAMAALGAACKVRRQIARNEVRSAARNGAPNSGTEGTEILAAGQIVLGIDLNLARERALGGEDKVRVACSREFTANRTSGVAAIAIPHRVDEKTSQPHQVAVLS